MNILVTGASRGIGKAICESLDGAVYASARNEEFLKGYKNYCAADLSKTEDLEKLGSYIETNKIDVLINNAGEYMYALSEMLSFSDIERLVKVNLEAPLYLISKAVPHMKKNRFGRIINIGSISGVMGEAGASIYSASKSGLIGMTKSLALELAEFGITVNTINPGWVDTDMGNSSIEEEGFSKEERVYSAKKVCIPR